MPVINHAVTVTIDGTDRTSFLVADSLYVRNTLGSVLDVATFRLRDPTGVYVPAGWDTVSISIGGVVVFGGYVVNKQAFPVGVHPHARTAIDVECQSYSLLLDTVTVEKQYIGQADTAIISDLFTTYLSGEGFDVSTYVTGQGSTDVSFERISLRAALDLLAALVDADWYIDPAQNLRWFDPANPGNAAFTINTVNPNDDTRIAPLGNTLRRTTDESTVINQVVVVGGELVNPTPQSDNFTGDGSAVVFGPLTQKPQSVLDVTWTSGAQDYAVSTLIGYEPHDKLQSEGGRHLVVVDLRTRSFRLESIPDNLTTVTVKYMYLTTYTVTVNHAASQTYYGRTLTRTLASEDVTDAETATALANDYLNAYAYGRETISFQMTRYGLLAGQLLSVLAPVPQVYAATTSDEILLRGVGASSSEAQTFLVQEVVTTVIVTDTDEFMAIVSVQAGAYQNTLVDALRKVNVLNPGTNVLNPLRYPGNLSSVSSHLGEIVAGRATLTDGGTAPMTWSLFHDHTGVVVGLDDSDTATSRGNVLVLNSGTITAQLGYVTGRPAIGTVTPSGWGVYTTNGYFSGQVAASVISGGTVTGNLVSGGTVTGSLVSGGTVTGTLVTGSTVSGGTVTGNLVTGGTVSGAYVTGGTVTGGLVTGNTIVGGTIATSTPPINSGNPGVIMYADGLYGYGSVGNTFALYSDGRPPLISSGTIQEMVFEAYTAGVFRTGADVATNGGVQIDSSGIFAYNSGGTLQFQVDAATGLLTANDGLFSGTVSAGGGDVTIDSSGVKINEGAAGVNAIRWLDGFGGDLAAVSTRLVSGSSIMNVSSGVSGTPGLMLLNASDGTNESRLQVNADTDVIGIYPNYDTTTAGTTEMYGATTRVFSNFILDGDVASDLIPDGDLTRELGVSGTAWQRAYVGTVETTRYNADYAKVNSGGTLEMAGNVLGNIIPTASDAYAVGASNAAYTSLYLHDGTDEWQITINTGGTLVTTKV